MRLVLLCSALVLCLTLSGADDFVYFFRSECHFSASDLRDLVYVRSMTFNGKERVRFNSTVGKYVGFDTWGEKQANYWNGQKDYIARLSADKDRFCKYNVQLMASGMQDRKIKPEVKIYPAKTASQGHTHMLVCHAHGFYPRQIAVSWLRNGQPVSSDLTSMSFASDGDWTYQTLLYLEFTPQGGETFECAVDHVALDGTLKLRWDPAAREAKRNKVIMGASGLVLGLVFAVIGVVYWKRKTKGHIAVPTVQS
uniref:Major histocompatibility complex class II DGB n=1 Tax=Lepisosteus oculatus TaxID=7918 RepID=W5MK87_LEPOC|nr:PREDICTED: HLA class II histocompatibility antigen, DR beta 4 chain-like isoform X1 [Lepisosteus oculatus]